MIFASGDWTKTSISGLLPGIDRILEIFGGGVAATKNSNERQALFDTMGVNAEYTKNAAAVEARLAEAGVGKAEWLKLVDATYTMSGFGRRSVYGRVPATFGDPCVAILTGGTTNWMQRRVAELRRAMSQGLKIERVLVLGGDRVCGTENEQLNPSIARFYEQAGRYPTEREAITGMLDGIADTQPLMVTGSLEDQLMQLMGQYDLSLRPVYVPLNANAASVALQIRRVIRSTIAGFDANPDDCAFTFSQDSFPLARVQKDEADPANFQNPFTVPSGLVRLVSELSLL